MLGDISGFATPIIGLMLTLIGFKIINPFKGKNEPEKEEAWYKKFGLFFKIAGIALLLGGIAELFRNF